METLSTEPIDMDLPAEPERPTFLKILCILSFIACGLCILGFSLGTICLTLDQETIDKFWPKIVESNPMFEDMDSMVFFHNLGMSCLYSLFFNIVSLIGVIMMWNLNKAGFFIYAVVELAQNFFKIDLTAAGAGSSHAGLIFNILFDLAFIIMYAVNLKYMNKKNRTIQA